MNSLRQLRQHLLPHLRPPLLPVHIRLLQQATHPMHHLLAIPPTLAIHLQDTLMHPHPEPLTHHLQVIPRCPL